MGFAAPMGLLLFLLAIPLVLLYVLKLRRRSVVVASTLPWRRVLADRRANAPWERLRRHLSLLLQLLILALLALAFAGPYRLAPTAIAAGTVLVVDTSASMGAQDGGSDDRGAGTRFDEARELVAEALLSVGPTRPAALVAAGPEPAIVAPMTSDRAALRRALDRMAPSEAPADVAAALELADTLAQGAGGEVVFVTDGAFDADDALRTRLRSVRVLGVGAAARDDDGAAPGNVGIVSLALRAVPAGAGVHEMLVALAWSGTDAPVALVLEAASPPAGASGAPRPASWSWREIAREPLAPVERSEGGGSAMHVATLRARPGDVLRARVEGGQRARVQGGQRARVKAGETRGLADGDADGDAGGDALAADDVAHLIVPGAAERRVLLSSQTPYLLERALVSLPGVDLSVTDGPPGAARELDVVVIEGALPEVLPSRPVLAFGPPTDGGDLVEAPSIVQWDRDHPVLRDVRIDAVRVAAATVGDVPPGGDVLIESDAGPIAVAWSGPGGRALSFRFALTDTDLPLRVAFPVLLANALDWLTDSGAQAGALPTGRGAEIAVGRADSAILTWSDHPVRSGSPGAERSSGRGPSGEPRSLEVRGGVVVLPPASRVGLARLVIDSDSTPQRSRLLAFALLSPEESDLAPRIALAADPEADGDVLASVDEGAVRVHGRRELWPWAVALALGVLLADWTVHHRRRE